MSPNAATHEHGGWALFLDVDGSILEIAQTPQDVSVPESLKHLLNELCLRLDGALALVSGRSLHDLDQLFALSLLGVSEVVRWLQTTPLSIPARSGGMAHVDYSTLRGSTE